VKPLTVFLVAVTPFVAAACASIVGVPDLPDIAGGGDGGETHDSTTGDGSGSSSGGDGQAEASADGSPDVSPEAEAGCPVPTTLDCDGSCVDPTTPAHCGTCNNACEGGAPLCSAGTCTSGCSGSTPTDCSGSCVNEQTDPQHCGGCTTVCPSPDGGVGSATCIDAGCGYQCAADGGTSTLCGSVCVNTTTDPDHCGGCATVCPTPTNGAAACLTNNGAPFCGVTCGTGYHGGGTACDTTCLPNTDDPSTDPCVVANAYGTFVSPTGNDAAGCGTMASPCLTIDNAMNVSVTAATKRVYACGTFTTAVVVGAAQDGVTVYGGFDCTGWAYSASTPTTVAPAAQGFALFVGGTTTGVAFHDFAFVALSAPNTASATPASSIAVFANGAVLTLTRATVTAGSGQPGATGATMSNWSGSATAGGTAGLTTGGVGGAEACSNGSSSAGGTGGFYNGAAGQPGTANGSATSQNGGLTNASSCTGGASCDGTAGAPATASGAGATSSGSVSSSGWAVGANGGTGTDGAPAQGGGGAGANDSSVAGVGGAGGGGGAGGCGGGPGTGGATGGSSIGILGYQATLSLTGSTIISGAGGSGGSGGAGQLGQAGAVGGNGACVGGTGGDGGAGSGGGGGAGGLSSGIVWSGTTGPSFNGTTYTTQAAPVTGITLGTQGAGGGSGATPAADAIFQSN
jgi:hypothetical protein